MSIPLTEYRSTVNAFVADYLAAQEIPSRSLIHYLLSYWPISLRQHWANMTENHEQSGVPYHEAEWLAFSFLVQDTYRHELKHPDKKIEWVEPLIDDDCFDNIIVVPDAAFFAALSAGAAYNAALPAFKWPAQLEAKEDTKALAKELKLLKQSAKKPRSTVQRVPKSESSSLAPRRRKSKYDNSMGGFTFHE